eukprot:TRINITY_DN2988_c0_g1_i1.p1 TRINITY_DN2988_c0_g1~~TRINITY_DN2988_c0_g1_i1.p1  ORF type:complete len:409 (+),score=87.56 TRINITY_DN2988_c0_g1_i1:30-1229(+)
MAIGAVFKDYNGKINSLDFHRTDDLLVTASDDESIRLYNTATASLVKTIHSKKYGVDQICFTHHPSSVIYSSKNGWDESLRYLSLYDNRYIRYFKGHRDRVVSLCMSPKTDCFMSGALDHTVRLWDLRTNACQGQMRLLGRPSVAYDQQGLVMAVSMEGGVVKLFDVRGYDKGPFDTFLVGGDNSEITSMKFSNDGKMMLLCTSGSRTYVLDAYTGNVIHAFNLVPDADGIPLDASFSPDGQYIVSGSGDGSVKAFSTASGTEVASWSNHAGVPAVVRWAPRRLLFASASVVLALWIPDLSKLMHTKADVPPGGGGAGAKAEVQAQQVNAAATATVQNSMTVMSSIRSGMATENFSNVAEAVPTNPCPPSVEILERQETQTEAAGTGSRDPLLSASESQ